MKRPVVRSLNALRTLAAGITLLSLGGMTAYATTNLHPESAPLSPAVASPSARAAATTTRPGTRGSTATAAPTIAPRVPTTTRRPITRTRAS